MNLFVVGDVHGCFQTMINLLAYWRRDRERLVFVGDLIDRGTQSARVVGHLMNLCAQFPHQVLILRGNHEVGLITYLRDGFNDEWLAKGGGETLADFQQHQMRLTDVANWMEQFPLCFLDHQVFISHAGLGPALNPISINEPDGVVWNRAELLCLPQLQIHGHRPLHRPHAVFTAATKSWNIDSGVYYGYGLSALRIDPAGHVSELLHVDTVVSDIKID